MLPGPSDEDGKQAGCDTGAAVAGRNGYRLKLADATNNNLTGNEAGEFAAGFGDEDSPRRVGFRQIGFPRGAWPARSFRDRSGEADDSVQVGGSHQPDLRTVGHSGFPGSLGEDFRVGASDIIAVERSGVGKVSRKQAGRGEAEGVGGSGRVVRMASGKLQ